MAAFPPEARRRAGQELFLVQDGQQPSDFKPMPSVGPGAFEIRVREPAGAFRVLYVAKFAKAVYVLHAFQKRSEETSMLDLQLARQRYRSIEKQP